MVDNPLVRGERIDDISGERMLRTKSVVDGDHDGLAGVGEHRAEGVVGFETADHTAALMEPDDRVGSTRGAGRVVEADGNVACGARDRAIVHRHLGDRGARCDLGHGVETVSDLLRRDVRVCAAGAGCLDKRGVGVDLKIEGVPVDRGRLAMTTPQHRLGEAALCPRARTLPMRS